MTPPAAPRWLRVAAGSGCNWTNRAMHGARAGSAPTDRACRRGSFRRMRSAWLLATHRGFWASVPIGSCAMKTRARRIKEEQPKLKGKEYEKQLHKLQVELCYLQD